MTEGGGREAHELMNFIENRAKSINFNSNLGLSSFDPKQTDFSLKKFLGRFLSVLICIVQTLYISSQAQTSLNLPPPHPLQDSTIQTQCSPAHPIH